jgi:predicted permease
LRRLPDEARALIDEVVSRTPFDEDHRRALRADLEQHFLDGLEDGRSIAELIERFGDPDAVAPVLARGAGPRPGRTSGAGGDGWLRTGLRDLRLAARSLARAPTLMATSALVIMLGVGVNTVVFTVVNELVLRPLPVDDPASLVDIWPDVPGGNSFLGISYGDFETYRDESQSLQQAAAFSGRRFRLGPAGATIDVIGQLVSPSYFEMLGLSPSVGRLSLSPDARFGEPPDAVLAHAFWIEAFGADPEIVGRSLLVDGVATTVVGVGPPGFGGHFIGFPSDLWLPITAADPLVAGFDPDDPAQKPFEMIGRLRRGVSVEGARAELNTIAERIEEVHPEINRGHRVGVTRTTGLDHSLQAGVTAFVAILTTVSLLVLLIACLNVGSVLLVRAMSRDRELSIRVALGAGTARLVGQLVTETALLVAIGSALGVALAVQLNALVIEGLRAVAPWIGLELGIDWRVLGLTCLAACIAALVASVAPALHVSRGDPAGALRARGGSARSGSRLRSVLVVGQVAASVVLVVTTGLFVRALVEGSRVDPGFDANRVAAFVLRLDVASEQARELEERVMEAIRGLPEVDAVSVADGLAMGVTRSPVGIVVPGVAPPPGRDRHVVDARTVGPGYLSVLGIELRAGRDFEPSDDRDGSQVAVVTEAFRAAYHPAGEPVGWTFDVEGSPVRVVGVAADARYLVQDAEPDPLVYLSRSGRMASPTLLVTLRAPVPTTLDRPVQEIVHTMIPDHPVIDLRTARNILDEALLPQRMAALLVGAMGLAALLLATVGLYGIVHFTVTRDQHEFGVRLALGGGRRDLMLIVLRKGFQLAGIGTLVGIGIALAAAPALGTFLVGVSPADPTTYLAVLACFTIVAFLASWLPARRVLRIDAAEALHHR